MSLNELPGTDIRNGRSKQKPEFSAKKELSLVERLDCLAKLLQHPITHSLQPSESTQDDSRGEMMLRNGVIKTAAAEKQAQKKETA